MAVAELVTDSHIVVDEKGVARIGKSRVSVMDIVLDRTAYNLTPEEIQREYEGLSLAQIYAALSWYYDHQAAVDGEIERRFRLAEQMRLDAEDSPAVKRLKAMGHG
jgi:uncharacterized protein (DUF433 family)